jgi:site-specific DNA recombinase
VQGILNGRHAKKNRRVKHDFAFSGLITCGHCGCSIVGEIKKRRYVYYHCTGFKGRCDEPYVREEVIEQQFTDLLGRLNFDDEVLEWVHEALDASHADERREHEEAIKRLRSEYDRLQNRIHAMYVDKLDGKVDGVFFERMSGEWRGEQECCQRDIERHQTADQSYLEEGVRLLELARNAQQLFEIQEARQKRRLLNFVVSNCSWKGGKLIVALRQPFDLLAKTTNAAARMTRDRQADLLKSQIWLPGPDSNQRPTG